jgi:hypothetical protein
VAVSFRQEFPWLDPGFIHAVDDRHADAFARRLVELEFKVSTLHIPASSAQSGRPGSALAIGLYRALGFTDHEPSSLEWNAVHDHFGDVEFPPRYALIWPRADDFAKRATRMFAEACAMLTMEFFELKGTQAVLVLTGRGPEFRSPRDIARR